MNKYTFYVLIILFSALYSCTNEIDCSEQPDTSDVDQQQLVKDINKIENYLNENNINYETHSSGLRYSIVESGEGNSPTFCSTVLLDYEGRVLSDSSTFIYQTDVRFAMSGNFVSNGLRLIPGMKLGIKQMNKGADYRIFIPSGLGYGEEGIRRADSTYVVPPNTNLEFRIRLNQY